MHDIRKIRENPNNFDKNLGRRHMLPSAKTILKIDTERRTKISESEKAQAERKKISERARQAKQENDIEQFKYLKSIINETKLNISKLEFDAKEADERLKQYLLNLPNIPETCVPDGKDENDNVKVNSWGTPRVFNFEAKEHFLVKGTGGLNFQDAAKISGGRFVILEGAMATLHRALAQFMLNTQIYEYGLTEVWTPLIVKRECMTGTGQLPKFAEDSYSISKDQWLIPTSEVSVTNIFSNKVLVESELPKRLVCHSQCFRSEAGSAGRDTSGMIRQHQFEKVEMISITTPENSKLELDRMTNCAQGILQALEIPFRTMLLCAGDMGFSASETRDIEVWLPGQNRYREISSCSLCGDFQARRMNARYRSEESSKLEFVHTLNGSGLAVGRCLIAVLENYQEHDGSIIIPKVLRTYLNNAKKISSDGKFL